MDIQASPLLRTTRAALLAAVVLLVGVVAHTSAGGLLPGSTGMVTLYLLTLAGCSLFLGREASTLKLVALTVGGQAFIHSALAAVAGHRGDHGQAAAHHVVATVPHPRIAPTTGSSGLMDAQDRLMQGLPQAQTGPAELAIPGWMVHTFADITANPLMASLHVLAAVLVGLWLAMGERALWTLIKLAASRFHALVADLGIAVSAQVAVLLGIDRATPVRPDTYFPLPVLAVWSRGPVRRGPPAALLAR